LLVVNILGSQLCTPYHNYYMDALTSLKNRFERFQQRYACIGFPLAVVKRYGEDRAGRDAALITYYAFLALFPLLLVFISLLGIIASGDVQLQTHLISRVFQYFPALGNELKGSVHTLKGSGLALILEILALLYGARGLASMLQETFNNVWHVEKEQRPNFISNNLRSFAMMFAVGVGIIAGTVLSYVLGSVLHIGITGTVLITVLNLLLTFGLFLVVFRLGTSDRITLRHLVVGAVLAGIFMLIVQHFGSYIMGRELPKLSGTYGSFALALGMMFWIYLQAQIILYALEITAVRALHDWPKKLF
jgi:YihY family inner membrane protein